MRPQVRVVYELVLINKNGEEFAETFSHHFDYEIYNSDVDGTDVTMVNFKVQDLKNMYEELFLLEFTVERDRVSYN